MFRRRSNLSLTAVVLTLTLAALPALAQGRPAAPVRPSAGAGQVADWMGLAWQFLTGLWSAEPARPRVAIRGNEGGSLDPDGKVRATTTPGAVIPLPGDEGGSLDPHG